MPALLVFFCQTSEVKINVGVRYVTGTSIPAFTLNKFLPFSEKCKQSKSYINLTFNSYSSCNVSPS